MFSKVAIKIFSLGCIIALLNFVYTLVFLPGDLREKSPEILQIRQTQGTDIYYFGESSNVTFREDDPVKTSISGLVAQFFPALKLTNINKYATHAGIYKHWAREISKLEKLPKAIVVTMNLRSFDAAWRNSELETALQESIVLCKPYPNIINRFFLSLQAFDNKTPRQRQQQMLDEWSSTKLEFPFPFRYQTVAAWDYAMSQGSYLKPDGKWDTEKIALACHYIKSYAFNLNDDNPRTRDFDELHRLCKTKGIRLYFNLLAENVQYADSLVGKELVFLMRQNRDYLVKRYSTDICKVIDNLELVAAESFIDKTWTTEHYDYKGRMLIASHVADSMKKQFKEQYKKAY
jgi:hypothetical protein